MFIFTAILQQFEIKPATQINRKMTLVLGLIISICGTFDCNLLEVVSFNWLGCEVKYEGITRRIVFWESDHTRLS